VTSPIESKKKRKTSEGEGEKGERNGREEGERKGMGGTGSLAQIPESAPVFRHRTYW